MSEKMTLEQAIIVLDDYFLHTSSQIAPKAYAVIRAHLNAAKGEAVAWRYRFYGSQGWVYATAREGLVDGRPLVESQPLYTHPASPNVVRDVETSCGRQVCPNCDSLLPNGCVGLFKDEKECQWEENKS